MIFTGTSPITSMTTFNGGIQQHNKSRPDEDLNPSKWRCGSPHQIKKLDQLRWWLCTQWWMKTYKCQLEPRGQHRYEDYGSWVHFYYLYVNQWFIFALCPPEVWCWTRWFRPLGESLHITLVWEWCQSLGLPFLEKWWDHHCKVSIYLSLSIKV